MTSIRRGWHYSVRRASTVSHESVPGVFLWADTVTLRSGAGFREVPRRPARDGGGRLVREQESVLGMRFDGIAPPRQTPAGKVVGDAADLWLRLNDPRYATKRRGY